MKTFVSSLFVLMLSFVSFSQVIEIEFKNHLGFNSGSFHSYEDMIKKENMLVTETRTNGVNKYIIDLDNKVGTLFYNNMFIKTVTIVSYKTKGDLIFIDVNDIESLTNKPVISHIVINKNKDNKKYPDFTFYFISTVDNTSNGFMTL